MFFIGFLTTCLSIWGLSYLGYGGDAIFYEIQENILAENIINLIARAKEQQILDQLALEIEVQKITLHAENLQSVQINKQNVLPSDLKTQEVDYLEIYAKMLSNAYHNVQWFVYNHHGYIFIGVGVVWFLLLQYADTRVKPEIPEVPAMPK